MDQPRPAAQIRYFSCVRASFAICDSFQCTKTVYHPAQTTGEHAQNCTYTSKQKDRRYRLLDDVSDGDDIGCCIHKMTPGENCRKECCSMEKLRSDVKWPYTLMQ